MIAVVAGAGFLPVQACQSLRKDNKPFFVISLFPDDNCVYIKQAPYSNCSSNMEQHMFFLLEKSTKASS
jgi:DUF1009 family protein